jgi:hypothetical protein
MVKILAIRAVSGVQRPADLRDVSTDSARPVRDEFRFWVGPVRDGVRGADALQSADEGGQQVGGRPRRWTVRGPDAPGTSEAYKHPDLHLLPVFRMPTRAGGGAHGPHPGPTPGNATQPRADCCRADMAASRAGQAPPRRFGVPAAVAPGARAPWEGVRVISRTRPGCA